MNKLPIILFLLFSVVRFSVLGQDFPVNDAGKIEFYEVVKADSATKDFLYHNAVKWFTSLKASGFDMVLTLDSLNGKVTAQNEFSVFSQTGVLKQLSGKITYQSSVEVKDKLYRYNFSNFVFHYYKQNRYYKIVATGKIKNLEDLNAPGWQKLWNKNREDLFEKIQQDIAKLKIKMIEVVSTPKQQLQKKKEIKWE